MNPGQALVKVWLGFLVSGLETVDATIADQPEREPELITHEQQLKLTLASTERKLAEARLQIAELEALLEEIPEIFERKFEQRLQPVLERQERLLDDNAALRQQIHQLAPVPGEVRLRFNPDVAAPNASSINLPQLPSRSAIRRAAGAERHGPRAA